MALAEEHVVHLAMNADFWFTTNALAIPGLPREAIKAAVNRQVYDPFRIIPEFGGADYYGMGMIRPDLMLKDLVAIMHPEHLPGHRLFFLQRQR
jgi:iron complex transport system substrate-binding protein